MPMGTKCYILGCDNSYKKTRCDKTIRYHPLPKNEEIRKVWIQCCQRGDSWNPQAAYICSKHFNQEDFVRDLKAELLGLPPKKHVKPTAIPSLYLPLSIPEQQHTSSNLDQRKLEDEEQTFRNSNVQNVDAAVQTDLYKENYHELLKRIGNLEAIIEQYKDIVHEYQIKNELLENSIREEAIVKEQAECCTESQDDSKLSLKHTNNFLTVDQVDFPIAKRKKLLWNTKDKLDNYCLKYLCKGCYIILP